MNSSTRIALVTGANKGVNNAGINDPADGPPTAADLNAVRRVMDTNFFGTLAVTQAMLPMLRKATAAWLSRMHRHRTDTPGWTD